MFQTTIIKVSYITDFWKTVSPNKGFDIYLVCYINDIIFDYLNMEDRTRSKIKSGIMAILQTMIKR